MTGSTFCYLHNPEVSEEDKKAAQAKGGRAAHGEPTSLLDPLPINSAADVLSLLYDTINRVRKVHGDGSMDIGTANSIGHLASKLLEAHKLITLEQRVAQMERQLNSKYGKTQEDSGADRAKVDAALKSIFSSSDES